MEVNDTLVYVAVAAAAAILFGNGVNYLLRWHSKRKKAASTVKLTPAEQKKIKNQIAARYKKEQEALFSERVAYKKLHDFDALKTKRSRLTIRYWVDWWHQRRSGSRIFLINMYLNNGFRKRFLIAQRENGFVYQGKQYVIDENCKHWGIDSRMYELDYVEDISLPLRLEFPVKKIKDTLKAVNMKDIELAINPSTLRSFVDSEIAKQVLQAAQLDAWLRQVRTMLIFILIGSVGGFLYHLYVTGAFSGLGGII